MGGVVRRMDRWCAIPGLGITPGTYGHGAAQETNLGTRSIMSQLIGGLETVSPKQKHILGQTVQATMFLL